MHPESTEDILFRGIPRRQDRKSPSFAASLVVHLTAVALLLLVAPQMILRHELHASTTLIAPVEAPASAPRPVVVQKAVVVPKPLRPLPRPEQPRMTMPKLDEAPVLAATPRPVTVPVPTPILVPRPPVQTGVFAVNLPPQTQPKLPVTEARNAGFDHATAPGPVVPQTAAAAPAGFDVHDVDKHVAPAATVQTGAFGQQTASNRSTPSVAGKVSRGAFDTPATEAKAAPAQAAVQKTAFDQKVAAAPAKQAAPAAATVRPVEILDKPKPSYTADARNQKIEGDVVLDVIFTANGEVHVLGVARGLGHGLDENAIDAARRIRFTPATQSGTPVDQRALLHVVFQITG